MATTTQRRALAAITIGGMLAPAAALAQPMDGSQPATVQPTPALIKDYSQNAVNGAVAPARADTLRLARRRSDAYLASLHRTAAGRPTWPVHSRVISREGAQPGAGRVEADGFDWGDAAIGAGGILALLGLSGGLTVAARYQRRERRVPVPTR